MKLCKYKFFNSIISKPQYSDIKNITGVDEICRNWLKSDECAISHVNRTYTSEFIKYVAKYYKTTMNNYLYGAK